MQSKIVFFRGVSRWYIGYIINYFLWACGVKIPIKDSQNLVLFYAQNNDFIFCRMFFSL